ncbi:hypothetical protein DL769_000629 [Monosporascus sp. CRB-8-3]|nr:hypothetical protein DL769_000629 [Monosporascus sp. CRB-8-3]
MPIQLPSACLERRATSLPPGHYPCPSTNPQRGGVNPQASVSPTIKGCASTAAQEAVGESQAATTVTGSDSSSHLSDKENLVPPPQGRRRPDSVTETRAAPPGEAFHDGRRLWGSREPSVEMGDGLPSSPELPRPLGLGVARVRFDRHHHGHPQPHALGADDPETKTPVGSSETTLRLVNPGGQDGCEMGVQPSSPLPQVPDNRNLDPPAPVRFLGLADWWIPIPPDVHLELDNLTRGVGGANILVRTHPPLIYIGAVVPSDWHYEPEIARLMAHRNRCRAMNVVLDLINEAAVAPGLVADPNRRFGLIDRHLLNEELAMWTDSARERASRLSLPLDRPAHRDAADRGGRAAGVRVLQQCLVQPGPARRTASAASVGSRVSPYPTGETASQLRRRGSPPAAGGQGPMHRPGNRGRVGDGL